MYFNEKTAASIIGKMLKAKQIKGRECLQYTWIDEKGRQCSCDGYRAYRLYTPVAGLPDIPAGLAIDLNRIFPDDACALAELETPAVDFVQALIKDDAAHKTHTKKSVDYYDDGDTRRGLYTFGKDLPAVNIKYLFDILRVFPDAKIYSHVRTYQGKKLIPNLYVVSEYGDALLMPVKHDGDSEKRPTPQPAKKAAAPAFSLAQFAARYAA